MKKQQKIELYSVFTLTPGADPGFQVWGGGGGALKKIAPSGGRREHCWGISCEKSRFYIKKSYFFQLRREARKFLGYFVWKITILRQKIIFFLILGGGGPRAGCAPPPLNPPLHTYSRVFSTFVESAEFSAKITLSVFCHMIASFIILKIMQFWFLCGMPNE